MYQSAVPVRAFACVLVSGAALFACGGKTSGAGSSSAPASTAPTAGAPAIPGGDTFATQKTGPIAPSCASSFCAEVELDSKLACRDTVSEVDFTLATRISGKTDQVSCYGDKNASGGLDLRVGISPDATASEDASNNEVWFKLRNYTGPGTYPLENLADDGDHMGLKLTGKSAGHSEGVITVGTVACIPKVCEAIVAEGSQPIPTDESTVHEFRVRVEIRCPRGGEVGNMHCEAGNTRCTFSETPTLLADLACRQ